MLKSNGFLVMSEVDDFENGCDPDSTQMREDDSRFVGKNEVELLDKIREYLGVEKDAILLNSCGENGRIDIQRMEDSEGCQADKNDITQWKKGKRTLYAVTYTTQVEKVSPFKFADVEGYENQGE